VCVCHVLLGREINNAKNALHINLTMCSYIVPVSLRLINGFFPSAVLGLPPHGYSTGCLSLTERTVVSKNKKHPSRSPLHRFPPGKSGAKEGVAAERVTQVLRLGQGKAASAREGVDVAPATKP